MRQSNLIPIPYQSLSYLIPISPDWKYIGKGLEMDKRSIGMFQIEIRLWARTNSILKFDSFFL